MFTTLLVSVELYQEDKTTTTLTKEFELDNNETNEALAQTVFSAATKCASILPI
jgi:hypothetical protein